MPHLHADISPLPRSWGIAVLSPEYWLLRQQPRTLVLTATDREVKVPKEPLPRLLYLGELFLPNLLSIFEVIQLYLAAET